MNPAPPATSLRERLSSWPSEAGSCLTGSLVVSAIGGPLAMSALASGNDLAALELLGRFSLVVLVPLVVGVAARTAATWLEDAEPHLAALSTLSVVALVYASLSAATDAAQLGQATVASLIFIGASAALGFVLLRRTAAGAAAELCTSMRDFAVVAVLATQAAGPSAATVAGVYGVLALVLGAAAASGSGILRTRRPPERATASL